MILAVFFSIVKMVEAGDFGMDYLKGHDNFYNLSGYNLLLKLQSKSKLLASSEDSGKATRAVKNIHAQITRKEMVTKNNNTEELEIIGNFKILNIVNETEIEK